MRSAMLLGVILIVGIVIGFLGHAAYRTQDFARPGANFVSGIGIGLGASVGLVLMIWLLKTIDRYLAAASTKR